MSYFDISVATTMEDSDVVGASTLKICTQSSHYRVFSSRFIGYCNFQAFMWKKQLELHFLLLCACV